MEKADLGLEYAVEEVNEQIAQPSQELSDVQLALVGGGCGETVFH